MRYYLFFTVFVTGACLLIIEIAAIRILSPYFGNTIYTVSSVISVVLAALSVGYYLGGRLADRQLSMPVFYIIVFTGGLSVLVLQLSTIFLLPLLGNNFSIVTGPLASAVLLFFLPSFLLAMLSPYAIALTKKLGKTAGIGRIVGEVFFWSTLGSIVGSLLAGFFFIPRFGVSFIIIATGTFLVATGLIGFIFWRGKQWLKWLLFSSPFLILVALNLPESHSYLYSRDGLYEKITIYDDSYQGKPARFLRQDRSASGAIFLSNEELVYDYTKYYMLYKLLDSQIKDALVIGGGAYSIPKALLGDLPEAIIDVVEIEPSLHLLAKKYFRLSSYARLNNYIKDGRQFLKNSGKSYDFIFSDVYYSLFSIPAHFTTQEFYGLVYSKLRPNGIFIANFIGDLDKEPPSLILSSIKTFQLIFPNSYFFAVQSPRSNNVQNIIFLGRKSSQKIDFDHLKKANQADLLLVSLSEKLIDIDQYDLSPYSILTDDYSPVEYLTAKVNRKNFLQN